MEELRTLLYKIGFQFYLGDFVFSSYAYPTLDNFKYRISFCEENRKELDLMGVGEENIILNKNKDFIININVECLKEYLKEEFKHDLRKKKIDMI